MPLHIDYRPKTFDDMIGNRGVVEAHKAIFSRKSDWPHAVLYIGPSGCGKTTMARIYANSLQCTKRDLNEINAANNRGIDTARKIQETMVYSAFESPVKCYLIDEIGATSKDFQTAMLKALEDAPPHVYFLMATTDPQNLLPTLRNRCSTFEMSLLSIDQLMDLIYFVLESEKVEDIPEVAIKEIAIVADGCPRQALVILDQIIDLAPEDMVEAIQDMRVEDKNTKDLCQALLKKKPWGEISKILKVIDMSDSERIRYGILGYMGAVLLNNDNPQAAYVMECFKENTYNTKKYGIITSAYNSVLN